MRRHWVRGSGSRAIWFAGGKCESARGGGALSDAGPSALSRALSRRREIRASDDFLETREALDIRDAQHEVDAYISQFREGYFPPLVNLARLTEEVGELARELNHQFGPKRKKPDEPAGDIALELGDILFVVVVLANQLGLDLSEAFARTLAKYRVRDADRWERHTPPGDKQG